MKATVRNDAPNPVERAGRIFPPRSTTTVTIDDAERLDEVRSCRHLELVDTEAGFDPSSANVGEVKDHVGDDPEVAAEVLDAELAGKNRPTLVEWLEEVAGAGEDGDEAEPPADEDGEGEGE